VFGFKSKNNADFDTLFNEYNAYVFKVVINESNNKLTKEDIEETVSDVFFLLWKNYGKIKNEKKTKPYIGKIAKNATKNKLRKIKEQYSFDETIFSKAEDNAHSYHVKDSVNMVRNELNKLEETDKQLFLMYYYENKKIKEIAVLKDMKVATVKTKLHRTRKRLKKLLERSGFKYER